MDDKNLSPEGAHKAFQRSDDWAMAMANKIVHLLVRCNADDCSTAMNVLTVAMARVISSLDRNDEARSTWFEEDECTSAEQQHCNCTVNFRRHIEKD
jgi:hypothetical protein